jgi:uncharacterized membrane protein YraQ (UPF0718 family)
MRGSAVLAVELVGLFFGVSFGVQLLQRRVGSDRLQAWLGGSASTAAVKGIVVGFITPFCTFTAVPMLIGFRRAGIRAAGYVAFIVAAPVLDPVLFGALVLIVGWGAATIYVCVAFVAALALALVADAVGIDRHLKPLPTPAHVRAPAVPVGVASNATFDRADDARSCATRCSTPDSEEWRGWGAEVSSAAASATLLLRSVALMLGVGVVVGLLIEAHVSPETTARITGGNDMLSIPIAAVLGTPLYFSTELFVPIADSLTAAGVGLGAIVALTISGAGASLPEFFLLTKLADIKILAIFFAFVLAIAMTGGFLVEATVG